MAEVSPHLCPEHSGNLLFNLQSSLIINRYSLSCSSLLSTLHTIFLFFTVLSSPHAFSPLFIHYCLCYPLLLSSFKSSSFHLKPSFSSLRCLFRQWWNPLAGLQEGKGGGIWTDWRPSVGLAACSFVLQPSKMEGTRQWTGGGEEDQLVSFMCRSFRNSALQWST